ncbi:MAG: acetylxylan esterase [Candidatus Hydrogenedentota bacterium]|mgnify:FL=1
MRSRLLTVSCSFMCALTGLAEQPVRENGTFPEDWEFNLPPGVTTHDVTYYSDETPCFARLFFPPDFDANGKTPGVVLGHGFGGMHHGIDKYGAYFASRGLVAMTIDYRGWGFSDALVTLLDPTVDVTTDDQRTTIIEDAQVEVRRTRLISMNQVEDYRNAISYLQGEPGVDRDRIGTWGSSHSGGHQVVLAATDARVKAAVAQVPAIGGNGQPKTPPVLRGPMLEEAINQARTNHATEALRGFSWRLMHENIPFNNGYRPFQYVERVPETTAILFIVAQNEELVNNQEHSYGASKLLKGPTKVIEVPGITHFQMYSFEAV